MISQIWLLALGILAAMGWALPSRAELPHPLRDPNGLSSATSETWLRVKTARVLLADYELLQRDFPQLRGLSRAAIDEWLVRNAALTSRAQAAQAVFNSAITTAGERKGFRPFGYGRGAVVEVENGGLLDLKGAGGAVLTKGKNGLLKSGSAIREFIVEKAVDRVLDHSGLEVRTIGSYAVLDLGFRDAQGNPVAILARQGHARAEKEVLMTRKNSFLSRELTGKVEAALRRYGITSAQPRDFDFELLNIQGNREETALVDFSTYRVQQKIGERAALWYPEEFSPKKPLIPQQVRRPDPRLALDWEKWGDGIRQQADTAEDNLGYFANEAAELFAQGNASRKDVENLFHAYLEDLSFPSEMKNWAREASCVRDVLLRTL